MRSLTFTEATTLAFPMGTSLQGKSAIITGASRGIGCAIARRLASEGAHVLLTAREAPRLHVLADEIARDGGCADWVALDLRLPESAARIVEAMFKAVGGIDILINKAGATKRGEFLYLCEEDWKDGYAWRLFGAVRLELVMN